MSDPWNDEGFGEGNEWGEDEDPLAPELEEGLLDPEELDDEPPWDGESDG